MYKCYQSFSLLCIDFVGLGKPDDVEISEINDTRIDGKLELYTDVHSGSYWLFLNKTQDKKLIMFVGGLRGDVAVTVIDANLIEVTYNYLNEPNYPPREATKYQLDLVKNETRNVSFMYKLLN